MAFKSEPEHDRHLKLLTKNFCNIDTNMVKGYGIKFQHHHKINDYNENMKQMKLNNRPLNELIDYDEKYGNHNKCIHRNKLKRNFDGTYTNNCLCNK